MIEMNIDNTLNQINDDIQFFKGLLSRLYQEKNEVENNISEAKKWSEKQPNLLIFLQNLQNALHQKNLGAFSQLLSYFVKDVLGKDKDIIFDLYTFRNLPALKIEALNDGCREDIYEGNGGSIANIVSTGLRLIVLSRLKNRKFIILDEPDCWLKPDHVTSFATIIGEISRKLQIQTVIISHHDWNYFKNYGRVIKLESDGKNLVTNVIHDTEFDGNCDYLKTVVLNNYMSHTNTVFSLHPYLTCIVGDNDIGKSVLVSAIKSVAYCESSDTVIKHHSNEAQVLIELSNDKTILWQRFKNTSHDNPQKVKFSLYSNGNLLFSEYNSVETPTFISNELNIVKVEDLDVQIGNQKQPVFLLSNDIKPNDKAKILSLGKESILVQKMMEKIKNKSRKFNQLLKDSEIKYDKLNKIIELLKDVEKYSNNVYELKIRQSTIQKNIEHSEILQNFLFDYTSFHSQGSVGLINHRVIIPKLIDTDILHKYSEDLTLAHYISSINNISLKDINLSSIVNTKELESAIQKLSVTEKAIKIPEVNKEVQQVEFKSTDNLVATIDELSNNLKIKNIGLINKKELENTIDKTIQTEIIELISLLGETKLKEDNLLDELKLVKLNSDSCLKELEELVSDGLTCPTCNQSINARKVLGYNE